MAWTTPVLVEIWDVALNTIFMYAGAAVDACPQIVDRLGCTSHSRFPLR
jgi:hypothetical protein